MAVAKFAWLLVLVVKQLAFLSLHPLMNVVPSPRQAHADNRDTERQHPKSQDWQKTKNPADEQQCCQEHTRKDAQCAAPAQPLQYQFLKRMLSLDGCRVHGSRPSKGNRLVRRADRDGLVAAGQDQST